MSDSDSSSENNSSENEIESPVDGPTPDWMKMATSASGGPSLTEEDTPDWLKDIKAGKTTKEEEAEEKADEEAEAGMSDLERLLAEEGIDLESVAEERPEAAEGMSARDWMISTSDDELIRSGVGADETDEAAESSEAQAEETAAEPKIADEPDEDASDLERLLAEEGIDLESVAEERPEAAEGMSAREWMISTSDDELIRSRIGADETEDEEGEPPELSQGESPPEPPEPSASTDDDDDNMVVEEDLPDWLNEIDDEAADLAGPSLAAPEPTEAEDGDDMMVVDEDLPDWLREDDGEAHQAPQPVPEAKDDDNDDMMVVDEDLPDWLREAEDDVPGVDDIASAETGAGDGPVLEEDLPDWLDDIEVTEGLDAEAPAPAEEAAVDEADLPDWLIEAGQEQVAPAPQPETAEDDEDKMVIDEDLPDWLREDEDEPAGAVEPEAELVVEEELPEWLRDEDEAPMVLEAEPVAPVPPDVVAAEAESIVVDEDLPDWLQAEEEAETAPAATPQVPAADEVADLPDWLGDEDDDDGGVAERDEDLPDWLNDIQQEETEAVVPIPEHSPEAPAAELIDEAELPDWLKEVQEEQDVEAPITSPTETAPAAEQELVLSDEELPDWLEDVQADEMAHPLFEAETEPVDQEDSEDVLPTWLSEEMTGSEAFEPSEPSPQELGEDVGDELPDWLQEVKDEAADLDLELDEGPAMPELVVEVETDTALIEDEELPDWLQDVEAGQESLAEAEEELPDMEPAVVAEASLFETVEIEPVAAEPVFEEAEAVDEEPVPAARPVDEPPVAGSGPAEMPDWLKKLREGEPEEAAAVAAPTRRSKPAAVPVPVPEVEPALAAVSVADEQDTLPTDADERLALARNARDGGDIAEAIRIYDSLVSSGSHLDSIIDDMEQTIKAYPTNYMLHQLLGDAMMKDGRLKGALEAYREALAKLT